MKRTIAAPSFTLFLLCVIASPGWAAPAVPPGPTPSLQRFGATELGTLKAIRESGQERVLVLSRAAALLPPGAAREDVMRRVEAIKRETRAQALQASAGFARARGEIARAAELEAAADLILHPRPQSLPPGGRAPERRVVAPGRAR